MRCGNATQDDVFLLALSDVCGAGAPTHGFVDGRDVYDEGRCAHVSDFARAMGGGRNTYHSSQPDSGSWWPRAPGGGDYGESAVHGRGYVYRYGNRICRIGYGVVRPALRVSLTSNQISYAGTICSDGTDAEVGGSPASAEQEFDNLLAGSQTAYSDGLALAAAKISLATYNDIDGHLGGWGSTTSPPTTMR